MIYLLVDGDYLLSGFKPTSDAAVQAATEALQKAVEEQLLHPRSARAGGAAPPSYTAQIQVRVVFFSSALLNSLPESQHQSVVSVMRRLRFQVVMLESIRGRVGSPIDGALCTKIVSLTAMPSAELPAFCLAAPTAYTASALDIATSKGSDVTFVVYDGDEVAEPLLGFISASFGGGVAKMPKAEGVAYVQNTEAAASALAVLQQEGKDLPIAVVSELKRLQSTLLDNGGKKGSGSASATTGRTSTAMIMESTRRRKEEQALFQPPPPIENCPNPFEDMQMNGGSRRNSREDGDAAAAITATTTDSATAPSATGKSDYPESTMLFGVRVHVSTETSPPAVVRAATLPDSAPPPLPPTSVVPTLPPSVLAQAPDGVTTQVPNGWAMLYDPAQHRHYYAYTDSKDRTRSTWEHPLGPAYGDEVQEAAEAWWVAKKQEGQTQALAAAGATAALPQGWEERVQEDTGRKYYVNHNTHETTWMPPSRQPQPGTPSSPLSVSTSVSASTRTNSHVAGASATVNPAAAASLSGSNSAAHRALPEGWEEKVDPRNGRTYYVHHATRETTWERPRNDAAPAATPAAAITVTTAAAATGATASDWEERVDPRNGRTYYVNHATRETSWTKPAADSSSRSPASTHSTTTTNTTATNGDWEAKVDPQTGRTFYVNHVTKQTSWTRPVEVPVAKASTPSASQTSSQISGNGTVEYPWETRTDQKTGRTYYVNHATKQTSWTRPH